MSATQPLNTAVPFQAPTNASAGGAALASEARQPAERLQGSSSNRQEAIYQAVARLLDETSTAEERRWSPRVQYVRPAWVHFKQPPGHETETEPILVVTTDISFEGVGVVSWQEIRGRHLFLEVSGVRFACNVRWREVLDHQIHRYGLHFYDVVSRPPAGDA